MKNKIIIFIILLFFIRGTDGFTRDLTLEKAIDMATSHSYQLKKAKAEYDASVSSVSSAKAERYPTLTLGGTISYKDKAPTLDINLGEISFSRQFGFKENYQADLRLSMLLFTGGKISNSINIAQANSDLSKAIENATIDEVVYLTRTEYLNLLLSSRLIDAAKSSSERANLIKHDVLSLYEAGSADSLDLIEAELAIVQADLLIKNSNNNKRQSELKLLILLGLDLNEDIKITDELISPSELSFHPPFIDSDKAELMAAQSLVDINKTLIKLKQSDYYPNLSLVGGYSYGKPNIDPFRDEFNDFFTIGANLSWSFNLGGKTSSEKNKAALSLKASQNNYETVNENLHKQASIIHRQLLFAYEKYTSVLKKQNLATDNYRLSKIKHGNGVLSTNRLLEIETTLSEAESELASSELQFYLIQSQLYYITGDPKLKEAI
jgi:outer membrane protein TolC